MLIAMNVYIHYTRSHHTCNIHLLLNTDIHSHGIMLMDDTQSLTNAGVHTYFHMSTDRQNHTYGADGVT